MWRRRQFVLAERTDTGLPQAAASSDSAVLVSAADSTGDSAGESVTRGTLYRLIVELAAEVWGE